MPISRLGPADAVRPASPLISIGMSVYNAERIVAFAIESICRQTYENWELLVVDDGSSDRTAEIVAAFDEPRIRLLRGDTNLGIAARLNQLIDLARGNYFARMDADDIAYPERLETQLRWLDKHADVDLLATRAMIFTGNGEAAGLFPLRETHDEICRRPWAGFYLPHPTWMGRTIWFKRHGYDAGARKGQDQVLLLKTYEQSRFACLPQPLMGYRQETLPLRKVLRGRIEFCRNLIRFARERRAYGFMMRGILEQIFKAAVEAVVIPTGAWRTVLRHRTLAAPVAAVEKWQTVWSAVAGGVAARAARLFT